MSLKEKGGFFLTRACCLINVGHLTKQENKHNSAITEQSTAESVLASIMHIFSFVEWGLFDADSSNSICHSHMYHYLERAAVQHLGLNTAWLVVLRDKITL